VFRFTRPKGHYGTGKNANRLKVSAPDFHLVKPDADKLQRAIGDSIEQSGLVRGDQQIVNWSVSKRWCVGTEVPGVLLTIISLPEG
jgi:crossover junction endodeoxyribonuclease RusA